MINNSINSLEPRTKKKVQSFLSLAKNDKLDCFIFEALRSTVRQHELFGFGRTQATLKKYKVDPKFAKPPEKKRTRTLESKHLIGQAVDIVFDWNSDPKIQRPVWNGDYERLIFIGKLVWLYNLSPREVCHFEDDGRTLQKVMDDNSIKRHKTTDPLYKDYLHKVNNTIRKYL